MNIGAFLHGFLSFTYPKLRRFLRNVMKFLLGQQFSQKSQEFRKNVHIQRLLLFCAIFFTEM
jgi:hypothetical protein